MLFWLAALIQGLILVAAYTVYPVLLTAPWWALWFPALFIAGLWAIYLLFMGLVMLFAIIALIASR
jgi:hypothetical protein